MAAFYFVIFIFGFVGAAPNKHDKKEEAHSGWGYGPNNGVSLTFYAWNLLISWYGGGPAFPRKVYERGGAYNKEKYICIWPQMVKLVYCDEYYGEINTSKFITTGFPPDYTLKQIARDVKLIYLVSIHDTFSSFKI